MVYSRMINADRTLLAALLIFSLLLFSLILMSGATNDSNSFGKIFSILVGVNTLGLIALIFMIGVNIKKLVHQLKEKRPGSRLTLRLVSIFIILAAIPVLIVYWFSTDFIKRGIDSWFDVRVEQALTDSLDLSRQSLDLRMRELMRVTEQYAEDLSNDTPAGTPSLDLELGDLNTRGNMQMINPVEISATKLDDLRTRSGAEEMTIFTRKGKILATSSIKTDIVPNTPGNSILLQLKQGRNYIGLEPIRDAGLFIRVVVNIPNFGMDTGSQILQALYPISTRINELAENVQSAYAKYKELAYLRNPLKVSFTMTLTLVLFFGILSAVWAAFYSARRLTAPIQDLAEGTRRITHGDYGKQLPVSSNDDLGFLVQSFNEMSSRIAIARAEVEAQRVYLEAVLGRLSSGVLTFDSELKLRTTNTSASQILDTPLDQFFGKKLSALPEIGETSSLFFENIKPEITHHTDDWQKQIVLFFPSGRKVLMCRGTALENASEEGHVIVFDDITALIQGQRDAAWGEVARRLAHEIKNPLTPIQLSAERLRHKYLKKMPPADVEILDRLTNTIIQQVDTLKSMVNSFSDYAKSPQIKLEAINLNSLIEEVVTLYQQMNTRLSVELHLDPQLPDIQADNNRLRQVMNNLVKNALEACENETKPEITIRSNLLQSVGGQEHIEVHIMDNGTGFPAETLNNVFEPYVTSKEKGTGLGLAIVKKIIEEHSGMVWIENNETKGATIILRLPANAETTNVVALK